MGGGTKTKTTQEPQVPAGVQALTDQSTKAVGAYQQAAPLTAFASPNVQRVAPLSQREQSAYSKIPRLSDIAQRRVTGSSLFQDPSQYSYTGPMVASGGSVASDVPVTVSGGRRLSPEIQSLNEAFDIAQRPSIENAAVLGGLSRSTALTNATAAARAGYLAPAMQEALAREERANQQEAALTQAEIQAESGAGATERGIEQAGYEAENADYLRRQALAEQSVYQVLGQLVPSTIGQASSTRGKQGIFTA